MSIVEQIMMEHGELHVAAKRAISQTDLNACMKPVAFAAVLLLTHYNTTSDGVRNVIAQMENNQDPDAWADVLIKWVTDPSTIPVSTVDYTEYPVIAVFRNKDGTIYNIRRMAQTGMNTKTGAFIAKQLHRVDYAIVTTFENGNERLVGRFGDYEGECPNDFFRTECDPVDITELLIEYALGVMTEYPYNLLELDVCAYISDLLYHTGSFLLCYRGIEAIAKKLSSTKEPTSDQLIVGFNRTYFIPTTIDSIFQYTNACANPSQHIDQLLFQTWSPNRRIELPDPEYGCHDRTPWQMLFERFYLMHYGVTEWSRDELQNYVTLAVNAEFLEQEQRVSLIKTLIREITCDVSTLGHPSGLTPVTVIKVILNTKLRGSSRNINGLVDLHELLSQIQHVPSKEEVIVRGMLFGEVVKEMTLNQDWMQMSYNRFCTIEQDLVKDLNPAETILFYAHAYYSGMVIMLEKATCFSDIERLTMFLRNLTAFGDEARHLTAFGDEARRHSPILGEHPLRPLKRVLTHMIDNMVTVRNCKIHDHNKTAGPDAQQPFIVNSRRNSKVRDEDVLEDYNTCMFTYRQIMSYLNDI